MDTLVTNSPPDDSNPLLNVSGLPRFKEIHPEHVEPALDNLLESNRAKLERLLANAEPYSWDNFAQAMEDMDEDLDRMWSPVSHLNAVCDSADLRDAYNRCLPKLTNYATEISQDPRVFQAYLQIAESADFRILSRAQKKIIDNTLRDFRLSGAELGGDAKKAFKAIRQELSTLTSRFEQNLLDATHAWSLSVTEREKLAGLPDTAMAMAAQAAKQDGVQGWKFTLDAPSYSAFMAYADDGELRRQMYEAYVCRASDLGPDANRWNNTGIIDRVLELRGEMARILGFKHYADYSLVSKMARDTDEVMKFLLDLADRSRPIAEKEIQELKDFAWDSDGVSDIQSWDLSYYSEKLRQSRYQFCQEDLRVYFPVPRVIEGMFEVVRRLYGLSITEKEGVCAWHPDVRFFEIVDANEEVRGQFFLDLYARNHKRGGAWMDECQSRKLSVNKSQLPIAYLTCNFSPPLEGKPSLLTHDEVITLFHEFGHGLHHMLTKVDYVGVAGINGVAWDAVELPSQFMENWCWQEETLEFLSGHYETGEVLPKELLNKMRTARNFQAGMNMARQLEFALFDMHLYSEFEPNGNKSVQQILDEVRASVAVVMPPPFNRFQNGFSHIFSGGYAAGYYSYKWAEVLSADAFAQFEECGVFNRDTGNAFLHHILEQGGTQEPIELFVAFRGREPTIDALLRHSGLSAC
ncbi:MAG: M3 family metallopeptidase [Gammaproteobacteria bacterium]|nr:M3 family metallopeptidase [Gammaproteobacteria bacterium]